MNQSDAEGKSASQSTVSSTAMTRLSGSWLLIARAVWLALVVPSLGLFVVGLPVYYQQLQRACVDPVTCSFNGALTAKGLQELAVLGFSVSAYAALWLRPPEPSRKRKTWLLARSDEKERVEP
jgi:hypothetical protein